MRLLYTALLATALAPCSFASTYHITVAGLGGEPDFEQRFTSLSREAETLLKPSNDTQVQTLSGANATKARLQAALRDVAGKAGKGDEVILLLIGHGSMDGGEYKLNLPGPDMTASELASALNGIAAPQLLINTTSSSGGSVPALQKPNRVVIAATKSGNERLATVFARYWIEALRDPASDSDKNESISALEAFRYADKKVQQFFEKQKRIPTEHALLDDTGKGEAVRDPSPKNGRGLLAGRFTILRMGATQQAAATPEKQRLLARREELERRIDQLKFQKAAMPSDQYRAQLSQALLELARVQAEIDK